MPERTSCEADDHDIEDRARIAERAVFAQAAEDVLDIDDGIIDEFADGDGEAAERHRVDGQARRNGRSWP